MVPEATSAILWLAASLPLVLLATALTQIPTQNMYLGGTAILIVVGVALDTMKQIETQLIMRQYKGFIK